MASSSSSAIQPKERFVWTPDLHSKFLCAVRTLPLEKRTPKEIMKHMDVPGLDRSIVSSHLQKFRLKLAKVEQQLYHGEAKVARVPYGEYRGYTIDSVRLALMRQMNEE